MTRDGSGRDGRGAPPPGAAAPAGGVAVPPVSLGVDVGAWYRDAWPRVVRAVALGTGDRDAAPDLAAEACARVVARWDQPTRPVDPTAWAVVVALNLAKRQWRRARLGRPERVWDGRTSHGLGEADLDLWRAVEQLPRRQRQAVALRYGADLPEAAVAAAMGITPGAAAATLHSARQRLRALLDDGSTDA